MERRTAYLAHRIMWRLTHGEIPPDRPFVLHRCDNPLCVRPSHLFLGTHADNMKDMVRKGRSSRGERHHASKLNEDKVRAIRADSRTLSAIASDYKISVPTAHA